MSNPNSRTNYGYGSQKTLLRMWMISVNRHTQHYKEPITSSLLKPATHKENTEADFLLYCISERDLKWVTQTHFGRSTNETIVPHLNEGIYSIKPLAQVWLLNNRAIQKASPKCNISSCQTHTHVCTLSTPAEERGESFMPHRDFGC